MNLQRKFREFLVPSGTFNHADDPNKDLEFARITMLLIYMFFTGLLALMCLNLFNSGHEKIIQSGYKIETLRAPSVAICPFWQETSIQYPASSSGAFVEVYKYTVDGLEQRTLSMSNCTFDRVCVCVDINASLDYHSPFGLASVGFAGVKSERDLGFHERVELRTNLTDESPDGVVKFGLYNAQDPAPTWIYANQGSYFIGQIELQIFNWQDFSIQRILTVLQGKGSGFTRIRQNWYWSAQEVANNAISRPEFNTVMSYEMKSFFVAVTTSSISPLNPYVLITIIGVLVVRTAVINVLRDNLLPEYKGKNYVLQRKVSANANFFIGWFLCLTTPCCMPCIMSCLVGRDEEGADESLSKSDGLEEQTRSEPSEALRPQSGSCGRCLLL